MSITPQELAEFDQYASLANEMIVATIGRLRQLVDDGVQREVAIGGLAAHLFDNTPHETAASIAAIAVARLEQLGEPGKLEP